MASSREEQRQPNIPRGSYLQEETVNPWGIEEVPSSSPARTEELTREARYDHLMEQVVERNNLLQALYRVERNKGAAGVDGMAIKSLRSFIVNNWTSIRDELLSGNYQPLPVRRVEIPKPDGGFRFVVDMDLEKFFDRVNHDILMSKLAKKIEDKRILKLIRRYLQAGIMVNGVCIASDEGTPQGGH